MKLSRRNFLAGSLTGAAVAGFAAPASAGFTSPPIRRQSDAKLVELAKRELQRNSGFFKFNDRVGIADFDIGSAEPRFHLVDMESGRIEDFLVTHGRGSDPSHLGWLQRFSNRMGSNATSRGAYLTQEYYYGAHDRSMRLMGLDSDNYMARDRAIVVHGAWYAEPNMIDRYGKLGRSEGCFAFPQEDLPVILERLGPGRLLFADKLDNGNGYNKPDESVASKDESDPAELWPATTFAGSR